ncbi:MAG TPA: hypothetical protein V6C81_14265 [Planktothrix sp.]
MNFFANPIPMRKRFYKVLEYVVCIVLEQIEGVRYRVRLRDTEFWGILICGRALSKGDEVLCQVGDSEENGDGMVLCMNYDVYDRFKDRTVTSEELDQLNAEQDEIYAGFRAELNRKGL